MFKNKTIYIDWDPNNNHVIFYKYIFFFFKKIIDDCYEDDLYHAYFMTNWYKQQKYKIIYKKFN